MGTVIETSGIVCTGDMAMIGAVQYLAVLAYPLDWKKRNKFMDALGRECLTQVKRRRKMKRTPVTHEAVGAAMSAEDAAAVVDRGLKLIDYRLDTWEAYALADYAGGTVTVEREDLDDCGSYLRSVRRVPASHSRAIRATAKQSGTTERTLRRHWGETELVLHLAGALRRVAGDHANVFALIEAASLWLPDTLDRAERYRTMTLVGKAARPTIGKQIRLVAE